MANLGGRPTDYSEELANKICDAIATTAKGLEHVCDENEDFPTARTVHYWAFKNPTFFQKYMKARKFQSHALMDRLMIVADEDEGDNLIKINRARLKIDAIKIASARFNKDDYSDKVESKQTIDLNVCEETEAVKRARKEYEKNV